MKIDDLAALWSGYRLRDISTVIDPADRMWLTRPEADHYRWVGESAVDVICGALLSAPTENVGRIMDFGCGHGRVARHLSALFPETQFFFCDLDFGAASFCADQFGGAAIPSTREPGCLDLPGDLDLIWVGSVFTHIDYPRMQVLFDALLSSLARNGILVATFHGRRFLEKATADPEWTGLSRPDSLVRQYEQQGVGFEPYRPSDGGGSGLSITSVEKVVALRSERTDARLIGFTEAGWAGLQDVAAWVKT